MKKKRRNRKKNSCSKSNYDDSMEVQPGSVNLSDYYRWNVPLEVNGNNYGNVPCYAPSYEHVQRDHVPSDFINPSVYPYYNSSEPECFSLRYPTPEPNRHPVDDVQYRHYVSQYPSAGRHFEPSIDKFYRRDVSVPALDDLYVPCPQTPQSYPDPSRKMNNLQSLYSISSRGYKESRPPIQNSYIEHRNPPGTHLPNKRNRFPFHSDSDPFVSGHL